MTFNEVLLELLAKLRAENKPILIGWDAVQLWSEHVFDSFLEFGLLYPASSAQSIECIACENNCFMDIIALPHNDPVLSRAFIICDDAEMQSQIGRVQVPLVRLQQWQSSVKQLARVIADLLDFKDKIEFTANQSTIKLGMLKSSMGRRWVSLNCADLSIVINQHSVPVDDVLYFENQQLFIDRDCIDDLLNRRPLQQDKTYTPSTNKREAKKLETQAMYQDWKDEYLRLKTLHPKRSDIQTWSSKKIAKMDIAKGKSSEYIRKNMI
jgi:hypothetical protein